MTLTGAFADSNFGSKRDEAQKVSKDLREESGKRMLFFRRWWEESVMRRAENDGSEALLILPSAREYGPWYRDSEPKYVRGQSSPVFCNACD